VIVTNLETISIVVVTVTTNLENTSLVPRKKQEKPVDTYNADIGQSSITLTA